MMIIKALTTLTHGNIFSKYYNIFSFMIANRPTQTHSYLSFPFNPLLYIPLLYNPLLYNQPHFIEG